MITDSRHSSVIAFFTIYFCLCLVALYGFISAVPVECSGLGDCVKYTVMTEAFRDWTPAAVDFPFNTRVLAPYLASLMPYSVVDSFLLLNLASQFIFFLFLSEIVRHLRLGVHAYAIMGSWFALHPSGFPVYLATPVLVDPLAYAVGAAVVLSYIKRWRLLTILFLVFGLLIKQSFLVMAVAIVLVELVISSRLVVVRDAGGNLQRPFRVDIKFDVLAFVFVLSLIGCVYVVAEFLQNVEREAFPATRYPVPSSLDTIKYFLREALSDPFRFLVWCGAFFAATGFFMVGCFPVRGNLSAIWCDRVFAFLFLGSGASVALGLLAGSDMTRIIFNGNIFILTFSFLCAAKSGFGIARSFLVFGFSSALVPLFYTDFFPAALEYAYYIEGDRIGIAAFVVMMVVGSGLLVSYGHLLDAWDGN